MRQVHRSALHDSGYKHTSGEAQYVDDLPRPRELLWALPVTSPHAHARVLERDAANARTLPGVHAVLFANDIPGENQIGPVAHDEPLLAVDEVCFAGQPVALVLAESIEAARAGALAVRVAYQPLEAVLDLRTAIAAESFHGGPVRIQRGSADSALTSAVLRLSGETTSGGQDHFYLETQAAQASLGEDGSLEIWSSTQHPAEVQTKVALVLGTRRHQVVVTCPRLGGGFGGKESQAAHYAALAALGAWHTQRPVRLRLCRDDDMVQTGKRHPWLSFWEAGFDADGLITALRVRTYANGGWSLDLSAAILQRCLFHLDGSYFIAHVDVEGRVVKTHTASNTAFRGFGGPQGMLVIEQIMNQAAETLGCDPTELRQKNLYGAAPRDLTHYGQAVTLNRLPRITRELLKSSDYDARARAIETFNGSSRFTKRGIAFQPVKFGIAFTTRMLNQAGAYVIVYADGSVQLNHGGIEMGQGIHTKMRAIAADVLGVDVGSVRVMPTSTDKVPNTSATAASSGTDLNGQAVLQACTHVQRELRRMMQNSFGLADDEAEALVFGDGVVKLPGRPKVTLTFPELAQRAYQQRVPLCAAGFYRTPGIHYDAATGRGKPFHYFAFGAAVVEVELSGLTGEHRLLRVDILHDAGDSLVPSIDIGQVEGGFVQGMGWLTMEELVWDAQGRLLTHAPSTYKIPAVGDAPADFRVQLLSQAPQPDVIHGSKAVGEPPLMLALGVVTALRRAVLAFGAKNTIVTLDPPCTPEAVLRAVDEVRLKSQ